jgi:hypothetical protein
MLILSQHQLTRRGEARRAPLARRLRRLQVGGASYAIEAVSWPDNVWYPIRVLDRCSAQ